MPTFIILGNLTQDGVKRIKDIAKALKNAEKLAESVGGKILSIYYTFGQYDWVGVVEAPRGMLIHDYTYDGEGRITKVNLIIPTNHNYGNIKYDLEKLIPGILNKTEEKIQFDCEMLIRAYDPCISCSTHLLDLKLVNK